MVYDIEDTCTLLLFRVSSAESECIVMVSSINSLVCLEYHRTHIFPSSHTHLTHTSLPSQTYPPSLQPSSTRDPELPASQPLSATQSPKPRPLPPGARWSGPLSGSTRPSPPAGGAPPARRTTPPLSSAAQSAGSSPPSNTGYANTFT